MTFDEWFSSAPHRAKYSKDHPAYLAAEEAWHGRAANQAYAMDYAILVLQAVANGDGVFLGDAERAIGMLESLKEKK